MKHHALIVIAASLFTGLMALLAYGVRFDGDTVRYTNGAMHLLTGQPFEAKEASYLGYVAVVATAFSAGAGPLSVVLFQILVGVLAAITLYDLSRELYGAHAALISSAIFILNIDIARRHVYILTDSLYISFIVIAVWAIHRAAVFRGLWFPVAIVVVTFTALLRPNGWLLVPIAIVYLLWRTVRSRAWAVVALVIVVAALVAVTAVVRPVRSAVDAERPDHWLRAGVIIWGYEQWKLPMPSDNAPEQGWTSGLIYAAQHPVASARLALTRLAVELLHVRPYYTAGRNALILAFYPLLYVLAIAGFARARAHPLGWLAASIIGTHLALVALTFADWSGRFLLYVVPLLSLAAGGGAITLSERFAQRRTRRGIT